MTGNGRSVREASGSPGVVGRWGAGRVLLAALLTSVAVAVVQSWWGELLTGFGFTGWRAGVIGVLLGLVDFGLVLGVLLVVVLLVGWMTSGPRGRGFATLGVVAAAVGVAAAVELLACLIELLIGGEVSARLVTDPARWTSVGLMGAFSLSNLALLVVLGVGAVGRLRWSGGRAGLLVLLVTMIGAATSAALPVG